MFMQSVHSQSTPHNCPWEKQSQYFALHLDLEQRHLNFFFVFIKSEFIDNKFNIFPSSELKNNYPNLSNLESLTCKHWNSRKGNTFSPRSIICPFCLLENYQSTTSLLFLESLSILILKDKFKGGKNKKIKLILLFLSGDIIFLLSSGAIFCILFLEINIIN